MSGYYYIKIRTEEENMEKHTYLYCIVADWMVKNSFESAEDGVWLVAFGSLWTILEQVFDGVAAVEDSILDISDRV